MKKQESWNELPTGVAWAELILNKGVEPQINTDERRFKEAWAGESFCLVGEVQNLAESWNTKLLSAFICGIPPEGLQICATPDRQTRVERWLDFLQNPAPWVLS